ncbi:hypothetical protein T265_03988 [Opisthorchis viverrini]|uniref:Uncharacterized protein n=1 Tax=Opisthorchis viverrini TaxID=6198 RepID=A0A074ZUA0_OPIVI|nr:hypothetical protein T265_03988 [Opisthorchis viverrini]KER29422.1 hypothetical protein T265_03988 [Opisthorchis viverrini]
MVRDIVRQNQSSPYWHRCIKGLFLFQLPQIIGERNLGIHNHGTTCTRCIIPGAITKGDISILTGKPRAGFMNLWHRRDISLSANDQIYNAAVRSILSYGSEICALRAEDVKSV